MSGHPGQEELWAAYGRTRSPADRERLILSYVRLVKHIAGRLAIGLPAHVSVEDLYGWGIFGLIDAVERFEPERGLNFETYAQSRIRGAMIDGLRAMDWVPHSARRLARELEEAYARVEARTARAAEAAEVAEELQISEAELLRRLALVQSLSLVSLDELWSAEAEGEENLRLIASIRDETAPDPAEQAVKADIKRLLAEAVGRLPERERLLVNLYYHENLTTKEIAAVMGVSPSRVSQLHTQAMLRLRARLTRHQPSLVRGGA